MKKKQSNGQMKHVTVSSTLSVLAILSMTAAVIVNFTVPVNKTDKEGKNVDNKAVAVSVIVLIILSFLFLLLGAFFSQF